MATDGTTRNLLSQALLYPAIAGGLTLVSVKYPGLAIPVIDTYDNGKFWKFIDNSHPRFIRLACDPKNKPCIIIIIKWAAESASYISNNYLLATNLHNYSYLTFTGYLYKENSHQLTFKDMDYIIECIKNDGSLDEWFK